MLKIDIYNTLKSGKYIMRVIIGFICIGNSCRSQMAEGFANHYESRSLEVYSAGTHPAAMVSQDAVLVMKEKGIDISRQYSKGLLDIPQEFDILITMGCGVRCPFLPAHYREDWGIEDPVGLSLEEFRNIRDIIEAKVQSILELIRSSEDKETLMDRLKKR